MKPAERHHRLAEEIQRVVAEVLRRDVKDFDFAMVTVIRCELARDLSEAKIRYSVLGTDEVRLRYAGQLAKIAGFVQRRIGDEIKSYRVPHLKFEFDSSVDEVMQLNKLFDQIARERPKNENA